MGYTTDFEGSFTVTPPLDAAQVAYLKALCDTRRMKRDAAVAALMPDPKREAVGLPIGDEAEYFVGGVGFAGQDRDASIEEYNYSPGEQPGLWLQWEPNDDGTRIVWNGAEKFYHYVEWLNYIIERFLIPWGRSIAGEVSYQGEDSDDRGVIGIRDGRAVRAPDTIIRGRP